MAEILIGRSKAHQRKATTENADYLRVIGAGLPRTGTSSVKAALEHLGFGPCHHMSELFDKPEQSIIFTKALSDKDVDFNKLLKGYGSCIDAPTYIFYKEIHKAYPKAKIILTVRDSGEKWYESFINSVSPPCIDITYYLSVYPIRHLRLQSFFCRKLAQSWVSEYGKLGPHIHDLHNEKVIRETRKEDLLVFNVKEGWEPLCKFLNVPIPENVPFPHVNDTTYIKRMLFTARVGGCVVWACAFGLIAIFIRLVI